MERWQLGLFTSINAGLGVKLETAKKLGVTTIQLHAPHQRARTSAEAKTLLGLLRHFGITLTAVFGGFEGESYADIPTVARTVGLVPREDRAARLEEMFQIANFARELDCPVVALHLGFVPHDRGEPLYGEALDVTRKLCDHCRSHGQALHLETGQEPADVLLEFLQVVGRDNLFVNFDPANMILYGAGNPIEALEKLGPHVRSVHCKDAKWAAQPGVEWGQEVPLGQGDVGMDRFLRTLQQIGYTGPLTIERELADAPERQRAEVIHALCLLENLKREILS